MQGIQGLRGEAGESGSRGTKVKVLHLSTPHNVPQSLWGEEVCDILNKKNVKQKLIIAWSDNHMTGEQFVSCSSFTYRVYQVTQGWWERLGHRG